MTELPSVENCDRSHTLRGHGTRRVRRVVATCQECGETRIIWPRWPMPSMCQPCLNYTRYTGFDEIAVERLLAGEPPARTTAAERAAAVAQLTRLGMSANDIATRLRITQRTVTRLRARTRQEANAA